MRKPAPGQRPSGATIRRLPHLNKAYRARVARVRQAETRQPAAVRVLRPPRAAGGVALAMLRPAEPLLRETGQPLILRAAPPLAGNRP